MADSIVSFVVVVSDFCIGHGTWLLLFFLRRWSFLSVYIVLINKALFIFVVPFTIIISLQVVIFAVGMYSVFLVRNGTPNYVDEFEIYGKMGQLMLGLYEPKDLLKSSEDFVALALFVLFIIITFLLMINALIGVMTNDLSNTQINHTKVEYLQTLSLIVYFEGLSVSFNLLVGKPLGRKDTQNRDRYVMAYRKVPSDAVDNPNKVEHNERNEFTETNQLRNEIHGILTGIQYARKSHSVKELLIYHYKK